MLVQQEEYSSPQSSPLPPRPLSQLWNRPMTSYISSEYPYIRKLHRAMLHTTQLTSKLDELKAASGCDEKVKASLDCLEKHIISVIDFHEDIKKFLIWNIPEVQATEDRIVEIECTEPSEEDRVPRIVSMMSDIIENPFKTPVPDEPYLRIAHSIISAVKSLGLSVAREHSDLSLDFSFETVKKGLFDLQNALLDDKRRLELFAAYIRGLEDIGGDSDACSPEKQEALNRAFSVNASIEHCQVLSSMEKKNESLRRVVDLLQQDVSGKHC